MRKKLNGSCEFGATIINTKWLCESSPMIMLKNCCMLLGPEWFGASRAFAERNNETENEDKSQTFDDTSRQAATAAHRSTP